MTEHETRPVAAPALLDVPHGYETTDADAPTLIKWGLGLIVVIFGAMALMWAVHTVLETPRVKLYHEPTAMELERILPPKPRLQVNQQLDLEQLRESERQRLNSYGWVQKQAGAVHIPIARAIDLLAERSAPGSKPAAAAK